MCMRMYVCAQVRSKGGQAAGALGCTHGAWWSQPPWPNRMSWRLARKGRFGSLLRQVPRAVLRCTITTPPPSCCSCKIHRASSAVGSRPPRRSVRTDASQAKMLRAAAVAQAAAVPKPACVALPPRCHLLQARAAGRGPVLAGAACSGRRRQPVACRAGPEEAAGLPAQAPGRCWPALLNPFWTCGGSTA